jgi:hypothetical protein
MTRLLGCLVAISLIAGCGDDDKGNGPIDNTARFDQIASALTSAESDFITSNADMTASLDYFSPYIAATIGAGALAKENSVTCFPAGVAGKIFNFNGTAYVADVDTGVVASSVRFRLYELSQGGTPILTEPSGHIQFTCEAGLGADVQIVSGTVLIASVTYVQHTREISGGIRSSDGSTEALIDGVLYNEGSLELNFLLEDDDMQATYEFPLSGTGTRIANASFWPYPDPDWGFFVDVTVDGNDDVTSGAAHFRVEPDIFPSVAACVASGTLVSPVFTAPTSECPEWEAERLNVSTAQLQDMAAAYHSLHELWDGIAGLVQANLAVLALGE